MSGRSKTKGVYFRGGIAYIRYQDARGADVRESTKQRAHPRGSGHVWQCSGRHHDARRRREFDGESSREWRATFAPRSISMWACRGWIHRRPGGADLPARVRCARRSGPVHVVETALSNVPATTHRAGRYSGAPSLDSAACPRQSEGARPIAACAEPEPRLTGSAAITSSSLGSCSFGLRYSFAENGAIEIGFVDVYAATSARSCRDLTRCKETWAGVLRPTVRERSPLLERTA